MRITLITVTLAVVALLFSSEGNWRIAIGPLHNIKLGYPFPDMFARLGVAEGVAHGVDVNHEQNPYSASPTLNNKPLYTVHTLAKLSIGNDDVVIMGILFGACFMAWNFWLLRPNRWFELICMLLVVISPPSLLLIERANDDIIIYSFIMAVPLLLRTNRTFGKVLSWLAISLLTPMKYYPAAAYALFLHRTRGLKEFLSYVGISILFGGTLLWLILDELKGVSERIPSPPANCAFGGKLLLQSLEVEESMQSMLFAIGILVIGLLVLLFVLNPKIQKPKADPQNELYFLLGSSVLTFCFLLNGNWDYRLAFLIPTLPLTFELLKNERQAIRLLASAYLISMLITLWTEYLYFFNAMDFINERWVLTENSYKLTQRSKHIASWLMITSGVLMATLTLKEDIKRLFSETTTNGSLFKKHIKS